MINEKNCYFSFSGLKSSVSQLVAKQHRMTQKKKADIAASFQKTVGDIIKIKMSYAISEFNFLNNKKTPSVVVAGGVAANQYLRKIFKSFENSHNAKVFFPSMEYCTDNAAMIAYAGLVRFEKKKFSKLSFKPKPRWPLDDKAVFVKGKGTR